MSRIIIDIKNNLTDVYYENNTCKYPIAILKDSIITINELTNRTVIKLVVELIYNLGKALKAIYKSV